MHSIRIYDITFTKKDKVKNYSINYQKLTILILNRYVILIHNHNPLMSVKGERKNEIFNSWGITWSPINNNY